MKHPNENEKARLLTMLQEKKITEADYKLLSEAMNKKSSYIHKLCSLLVNPFQKIAGMYALICGWVIIMLMSYAGSFGQFYFVGIFGILNASVLKTQEIQPTFFLLLYQNIVGWFVLSLLFLGAAKIFQQKRLRWIDFFGTVALSRFPFLILTLLLSIIRITNPKLIDLDLTKGLDFHPSIQISLFGIGIVVCFIWQIITYFYALKESSGLIGKNLWISFIVTLVLGEAISVPLTTIFF